jgi:Ran GTPase-activating protein 1
LILANNGLGPEAGGRIADALSRLSAAKSTVDTSVSHAPLKTLVCGRNRLGDSTMSPWAKCFSLNRSLTTIRMPQNGIRPEGIALILQEGVMHCRKLKILDLQDNTFTLKGALALADTLSSLPGLTDLGVGDCLLSARGGVVVAEALKKGHNSKLEFVRLQYNEIDINGAKEFSAAVKFGLPALKMIELNGNKFDEDDEVVEDFRNIFLKRGFGEIDELDDMEGLSEEEEEEDSETEALGQASAARDILNKQTKEEEEEDVAPEADKETDLLADLLAKTTID